MEKINAEKLLRNVVKLLLILGILTLIFAVFAVLSGNIIYGICLYSVSAFSVALNIYNLKNFNHVQN